MTVSKCACLDVSIGSVVAIKQGRWLGGFVWGKEKGLTGVDYGKTELADWKTLAFLKSYIVFAHKLLQYIDMEAVTDVEKWAILNALPLATAYDLFVDVEV